jgi:hypothetical protein
VTIRAVVEGVGELRFPDGTDQSVVDSVVKRTIAERNASQSKSASAPAPVTYGALGDSVPTPVDQPAPAGEAPAESEVDYGPDLERLRSYQNKGVMERGADDLSFIGDRLKYLYGEAGRLSGKAVTGGFTQPADAAVGVANYLSGTNVEHPSEAINRLLEKYVAPPPESGMGRFVEDLYAAALGGKLPSFMPKLPAQPPKAPPRLAAPPVPTQRIIEAGVKHDVPVYYDDLTNNALVKKIGVAAETLGAAGTGAGRGRQNVAAADAAKRFVAEAQPQGVEDVAGGIQEGLKRQLKIFRQQKDRLYEIAGRALEPAGNVPTVAFNDRLNRVINEETKRAALGVDNKQLMNTLETWKSHGKWGSFQDTAALRSTIDDEIDNYFRGRHSTIGKKGVRDLIAMREALDNDLEAFAKNVGGEAEKAWRAADKFYKTNLVPFKVKGFKDLVKTDEPEKAWTYLTAQSGLGSRAKRMYDALDEKGRQTVRYGLAKEAYDNALNENGIFSPAKFATYMEKNDKVVKQFFDGKDLEEINGFSKLMRHVERAGHYAENPPTGNRFALPIALGATAVTFGGALATSLGIKQLFQTNTGRDLLLRMSQQKVGSPAANMTANRIGRYITSAAGQTNLEVRQALSEDAEPEGAQ